MKNFIFPELEFSLKSSERSFYNFKKEVIKITEHLEEKEKSVGTNSDAFLNIYRYVKNGIVQQNKSVKGITPVPAQVHVFVGVERRKRWQYIEGYA